MTRSNDAVEMANRYTEVYRLGKEPVMLDIERAVLGVDYGGAGYTTLAQAEQMARLLELQPGERLLDIGAGAGWPGLFLAEATGCDVTLIDVPLEGLRTAAERAQSERLAGACEQVSADATSLPFKAGRFDAISHADLMC